MAKKKENTPQEKKRIKTVIIFTLFIVPLCICSVLLWFHFVQSPDATYSKEQKKIIERTKWNIIIPSSTWQKTNTNTEESLLPSILRECKTISFSSDMKTVIFKTDNINIEGTFNMKDTNSGTIQIMKETFDAKFSDQSKQLFDTNNYMMRIYNKNEEAADFFIL